MKNKEARQKLAVLYEMRCLLTNIQGEQDLDYHHVIKAEWGGKANVHDGANINHTIHTWLHDEIEHNDIELYYLINECLQLYKKCLDTKQYNLINQYETECMPIFYEKYMAYKKKRR